jgi:hypothetical protein
MPPTMHTLNAQYSGVPGTLAANVMQQLLGEISFSQPPAPLRGLEIKVDHADTVAR